MLLVDVDADSDLRMLAKVRWLGAIAILNNGSRSRWIHALLTAATRPLSPNRCYSISRFRICMMPDQRRRQTTTTTTKRKDTRIWEYFVWVKLDKVQDLTPTNLAFYNMLIRAYHHVSLNPLSIRYGTYYMKTDTYIHYSILSGRTTPRRETSYLDPKKTLLLLKRWENVFL